MDRRRTPSGGASELSVATGFTAIRRRPAKRWNDVWIQVWHLLKPVCGVSGEAGAPQHSVASSPDSKSVTVRLK
jgi:hypothetical protein